MTHYREMQEKVAEIAKKCGRNADDITIVAATKYQSVETLQQLFDDGCRDFGESKVQDALEKVNALADYQINWHFIGTLQKNKVRKVIGKFQLIHSVDTPELAKKISECSIELGINSAILLQVNTSEELSKHGLSAEQWKRSFDQVASLPSIHVKGLMTMAPMTDDEKVIRSCFSQLRLLRDGLNPTMPYLSMGMSHDYHYAIEEGATHLRIGTALF